MIEPFTVIVEDPPWPFGDKLPGGGRGAEKHYKTMKQPDIEAFRYPFEVANDALLFLWRVSSMPEEACRVMRARGFTPKSEMVWSKRTKNGLPHFGMGRYVRLGHEVCMIGSRGKGLSLITDHSVRSMFEAPEEGIFLEPITFEAATGRHSQKPDEFYDLVQKLTGKERRYADMFARCHRPGWSCFGDQLPEIP